MNEGMGSLCAKKKFKEIEQRKGKQVVTSGVQGVNNSLVQDIPGKRLSDFGGILKVRLQDLLMDWMKDVKEKQKSRMVKTGRRAVRMKLLIGQIRFEMVIVSPIGDTELATYLYKHSLI